MKVYQVSKLWFDGGHDSGCYTSPIFSSRELAEDFLQQILDQEKEKYSKKVWSCYYDDDHGYVKPSICEMEVHTKRSELKDYSQYK